MELGDHSKAVSQLLNKLLVSLAGLLKHFAIESGLLSEVPQQAGPQLLPVQVNVALDIYKLLKQNLAELDRESTATCDILGIGTTPSLTDTEKDKQRVLGEQRLS